MSYETPVITLDPGVFSDAISREVKTLGFEFSEEIQADHDMVQIAVYGGCSSKIIKRIDYVANNHGWYIAGWKSVDGERYLTFFPINPKTIDNIMPFGFHACPRLVLNKILDHGLIPFSSKKWDNIQPAVYLCAEADQAEHMARQMVASKEKTKGEWIVLQVNTNGISLHNDPEKGGDTVSLFTRQAIYPKNIKIHHGFDIGIRKTYTPKPMPS